MSPFAHVMFTSVTGFALGLAARRGATTAQAVGPWMIGLIGAIALHAFWNGSAVFSDFFTLYLAPQVPLFVVFILGSARAAARGGRGSPARRLGDYATAGWFTPQEVDMLATPAGPPRRRCAWAKTLRGDRTAIMKRFILDATALADGPSARDHRARRGGGRGRARAAARTAARGRRCSRRDARRRAIGVGA